MSTDYSNRLKTSTLENLPNLDEVVLGALSFLSTTGVPTFPDISAKRPLVVGSGNAFVTGRILFEQYDALYADEGGYTSLLERFEAIDAVCLISASGAKHAVRIADDAVARGKEVYLFTSHADAPARNHIPDDHVFVFPHIREPYTYNTSTYLALLLSRTGESPQGILEYIETHIAPYVPHDIGKYSAYMLLADPKFENVLPYFKTKFDELFGPLVTGRAFTLEEVKHAKTVITSSEEATIVFGTAQAEYGEAGGRITVPLPLGAGPAALMMIGYYIIGRIQAGKHPYFKERIRAYVETAGKWFGHPLAPIVE
jgi:hypothetical protein